VIEAPNQRPGKFIQEVNPLIKKIGPKIPDPLKGRQYL
jgi:hypothetical protein